MYVEIASRQTGKSHNIIKEVLKILGEDVNAIVAITAHNRDCIMDLNMKVQHSGISPQEYSRIYWFSITDINWNRGRDFSKYHTVFFDEFTAMKYVEPMRNGYYVGTPTAFDNVNTARIIHFNGGKYVRKTRTCKLLRKKYKGKGKANLSR